MLTTQDRLLAGRVQYTQSATGFRSGIEPVLLAASIPAQAGNLVLEGGTGAGAALLCLAARVADIRGVGIEINESLAALASGNAHANGFSGIEISVGAVEDFTSTQTFHHAMANPPYHPPDGTPSPHAEREIAKRGSAASMRSWIDRMSRCLRHRGTLTLILPPAAVPICLTAMAESGSPCTTLLPLWPRTGLPAKLIILRGVKDARTPMRLLPGLVLHQANGAFTPAVQDILNGGRALTLDD